MTPSISDAWRQRSPWSPRPIPAGAISVKQCGRVPTDDRFRPAAEARPPTTRRSQSSCSHIAWCYRFGDIPITKDHAADVAGGAFVRGRPRRLCIGSQAFLHPAVPALHSASCALPAARRDRPGVAGFVRNRQRHHRRRGCCSGACNIRASGWHATLELLGGGAVVFAVRAIRAMGYPFQSGQASCDRVPSPIGHALKDHDAGASHGVGTSRGSHTAPAGRRGRPNALVPGRDARRT